MLWESGRSMSLPERLDSSLDHPKSMLHLHLACNMVGQSCTLTQPLESRCLWLLDSHVFLAVRDWSAGSGLCCSRLLDLEQVYITSLEGVCPHVQ